MFGKILNQKTEDDIIKERTIKSISNLFNNLNIPDKENIIKKLGEIFNIQILNVKELAYNNARLVNIDIPKFKSLKENRNISFTIEPIRKFNKDSKANKILTGTHINGNGDDINEDIDIEMAISDNNKGKSDKIEIDNDNYEKNKKQNVVNKEESLSIEDKCKSEKKTKENIQNKNNRKYEICNNSNKDHYYGIIKCLTLKEVKNIYQSVNDDPDIIDYSLYKDSRNEFSPDYYFLIEYTNINIKTRYKKNLLDIYFYNKKEYIKVLKMKGAMEIDYEDL